MIKRQNPTEPMDRQSFKQMLGLALAVCVLSQVLVCGIESDAADASRINQAKKLEASADALRNQGKLSEAVPLLIQSASILEKELGEKNVLVADTLSKLAECTLVSGMTQDSKPNDTNTKAALQILTRVVSIRDQLQQPRMHDIQDLAECHILLKQYAEAVKLLERALILAPKECGVNSLQEENVQQRIADCYQYLEKYKEAGPYLKKAIEILDKNSSFRDTAVVGTLLLRLGTCQILEEKLTDAVPVLERAVSLLRKEKGIKVQSNAAIAKGFLGNCYLALGRLPEAAATLKSAIAEMKGLVQENPELDERMVQAKLALERVEKAAKSKQ